MFPVDNSLSDSVFQMFVDVLRECQVAASIDPNGMLELDGPGQGMNGRIPDPMWMALFLRMLQREICIVLERAESAQAEQDLGPVSGIFSDYRCSHGSGK